MLSVLSGREVGGRQPEGGEQRAVSASPDHLQPRIEAYLATGRRDPRGLLAVLAAEEPQRVARVTAVEVAAVDPSGDSALDVDTPMDLARIARRGIPPSAP